MELTQQTGPAQPLITIEQVKSILRLTTDEDDMLLSQICAMATDLVQRCVGRSFLRQTWVVAHRNNRFTLPMWPIGQVISVRRRGLMLKLAEHSGALKQDEYRLSPALGHEASNLPTTIETVFAYSSPKITVTYQAGFGDDAKNVPQHYTFSVLRSAVWLYRNITQEVPWTPESFALQCLGHSHGPSMAFAVPPSTVSIIGPKRGGIGRDDGDQD